MRRDTQAKTKIINFLLDRPGEKFYLSQIARKTGVSDSTVHQILEKTKNEGVVQKEKLGNLSLYSVHYADPVVKQMKILHTTELLKPLINRLQEFSQKIVLYGSSARGEDTQESDIDLFVLTNESEEARKIVANHTFGRKVQAVMKNFTEWVELKEKDKFFYEEIQKGITLWETNERI